MAASLSGPLVLPLRRVGSRHLTKGSSLASFYVGEISVGSPPKTMQVTFDTATGNVLLPHRACEDQACRERRRYSPQGSLSAMDVNLAGDAVEVGHRLAADNTTRDTVMLEYSQSDFGLGQAQTVTVRDRLCVQAGDEPSGTGCVDLTVLTAVSMKGDAFHLMPGDGIVGLGLEGLAPGCPLCSFLGRLFESSAGRVLPQIGLALGAEHGELHLGGHDLASLGAPLHWFPVDHPEMGYWQVAIQAVRLGNQTLDSCRHGCHGIVDSGTSRLGVQKGARPEALRSALSGGLARASNEAGRLGCQGPALSFDLGGMVLTLEAQDYADGDCSLLLGDVEVPEDEFDDVYTFGSVLLRRYYAAFDWKEKKLGFAPLAQRRDSASFVSQTIPDDLAGVLHV